MVVQCTGIMKCKIIFGHAFALISIACATQALAAPLGFTGKYYRASEGLESDGPVLEVIVTPDYKISYSLEECSKPLEPAGNTWQSLKPQNTDNHTRFEATSGDFEHQALNSLHVLIESRGTYKVLQFILFHKTKQITQELYPNIQAPGNGPPTGTALNTGGTTPQGNGTVPMGRPCGTCRPKRTGNGPDFFHAPTPDDALPECAEGNSVKTAGPGPRSSASRDAPSRDSATRDTPSRDSTSRGTSARDKFSPPINFESFHYTPPAAPSTNVAPEPAAPSPPRVQALDGVPPPKSPGSNTAPMPPALKTGDNLSPQIRE